MKKITYAELCEKFREFNKKHKTGEEITGVIVYSAKNWKKEFPLESRSYRISSYNRAFQDSKIANSIIGESLDGVDVGVRLDWYNWKIDYCYLDEAKA